MTEFTFKDVLEGVVALSVTAVFVAGAAWVAVGVAISVADMLKKTGAHRNDEGGDW